MKLSKDAGPSKVTIREVADQYRAQIDGLMERAAAAGQPYADEESLLADMLSDIIEVWDDSQTFQDSEEAE